MNHKESIVARCNIDFFLIINEESSYKKHQKTKFCQDEIHVCFRKGILKIDEDA